MAKKANIFDLPVEAVADALSATYEKETLVECIENAYNQDQIERECFRRARDMFIDEAVQNILTARENNMEMDDEAFARMIANAEKEISCAEKLDRMLLNKHVKKSNIADRLAVMGEGATQAISQIALKSNTYGWSQKLGTVVRKIFTKK